MRLHENRFTGKVAVVTGATRGIGNEIARQLASEGARVFVLGTEDTSVTRVAAELSAEFGAEVSGAALDVSDEAAVRVLCEEVRVAAGSVDVLVNSAAISARDRVVNTSLSTWERVMAVNLTGTFLMARGLVPLMRSGSSIVTISSQAGKRGEALVAAYAASKAGQLGLTKSLARELAPGIRVNAICPGIVETSLMLEHYEALASLDGRSVDEVRAELISAVPLGRPQEAHSIARLALFLASDDARDLTGQALDASGGLVMA